MWREVKKNFYTLPILQKCSASYLLISLGDTRVRGFHIVTYVILLVKYIENALKILENPIGLTAIYL